MDLNKIRVVSAADKMLDSLYAARETIAKNTLEVVDLLMLNDNDESSDEQGIL